MCGGEVGEEKKTRWRWGYEEKEMEGEEKERGRGSPKVEREGVSWIGYAYRG